MADPRRTFAPVVLLGLASAGLAALAGSRAWVDFDVVEDSDSGSGAYSSTIGITLDALPAAPLVAALALVVLASWGVLLVTRGRFRRGVALLAVVASAGMLAAAGVAFATTPDSLRDTFADLQVPIDVHRTAWPWVGLAALARGAGRDRAGLASGAWMARDGQPVRRPRLGPATPRRNRPRPVAGPRRRTRSDPAGRPADATPRLSPGSTRRPSRRKGARMAHHGNTPAAWTAVTVAMLGFVVGGIALMLDPISMALFWVGCALGVASLVVFVVMAKMGMNE